MANFVFYRLMHFHPSLSKTNEGDSNLITSPASKCMEKLTCLAYNYKIITLFYVFQQSYRSAPQTVFVLL